MEKKFLEYYPNQIAKDNSFEKYLEKERRFYQIYIEETIFEDDEEGVKKAYVYQEFQIWKEWKAAGENIFHFSKNLIELLKENDVLDIDLSSIKLPYTHFYIDLSEAKIPLENNKNEFIEGAFIGNEWEDGINGNAFDRVISIEFVSNSYLDKYWETNRDICWESERGFHSIILYYHKIDHLITVGDAIKFCKDKFVIDYEFDERDDDTKIDLYLIHKQLVDRTINLAINSILYLRSEAADISKKCPVNLPLHTNSAVESQQDVDHAHTLEERFNNIKYVGFNS